MTNKPNSRGSEWRKWDLHVHIPSMCKDDKAWFDFLRCVAFSRLSAVGITDYFKFDLQIAFEEIKTNFLSNPNIFSDDFFDDAIFPDKTYQDEKDKKKRRDLMIDRLKKIKFFYNIEFRSSDKFLKDSTDTKEDFANFHLICDNFTDSERQSVKKLIDSVKVPSHNDTIGQLKTNDINSATLSFNEFVEYLKDKCQTENEYRFFSNRYILVTVASGYGQCRNHNYTPQKDRNGRLADKYFIDPVKIFFGNENTYERFSKTHGYHKPCLVGCDHELDKIGIIFTWIKADPTFEGLKQIIYEPEDRVRIQDEKPEQKPADKTIDKVQFDSNDFTKNEILLNQNLTVIIGGKSTGKSILLKKIAQTVDSEEVAKKTKDIANPSVDDIKFKVLWKDGRENNDKRKIIYIPQSYLNRLADEKNDDEIIKIIRDALEQEDAIKNIFHKVKIQQDDNQTEINKNINALLTQKQNIAKMEDAIKIIGVQSTIEETIKRLEKEIVDEKLKTSDVTDDYFARYKELLELQDTLNKEYIKNNNDKNILENIKKAELFKCPEYDNLSLDIANSVAKYLEQIKTKYLTEWGRDIDLEITKVIKLNTENNVKIVKNNESLKPLQEKVEKAKTLHEKIKSLTAEQDRLKKIKDEELKLKAGKDNFNTLKSRIVDLHIEFFNLLVSAKADVLNQKTIKKENGLEFDVSIEFQKNSFASRENGASSFVNSYCDGRKIGNHKLNDYQFSGIDDYKTDFQEWINELLGGTFPLNSKVQMLDAIKRLANNWFEFKYHITHDGDKILKMSSGKRSFVILKLLIELDNTNKCPILLDQPEDDLDNRSIFTELVKFIKEKKKERQIIITTHNPNLVVGTDAECVIVANQHGEKTKNIDNIKFNYIQGALENIHKDKGDLALDKQSIQGHVCYILEGGQDAFEKRRKKYNFDKLKNAN